MRPLHICLYLISPFSWIIFLSVDFKSTFLSGILNFRIHGFSSSLNSLLSINMLSVFLIAILFSILDSSLRGWWFVCAFSPTSVLLSLEIWDWISCELIASSNLDSFIASCCIDTPSSSCEQRFSTCMIPSLPLSIFSMSKGWS